MEGAACISQFEATDPHHSLPDLPLLYLFHDPHELPGAPPETNFIALGGVYQSQRPQGRAQPCPLDVL